MAALGAKVIATASTPSKLEVCLRYGNADHAIDYTKPNWQQEVLKITKRKGVGQFDTNLEDDILTMLLLIDVIYDPVGLIKG